MPTEEARAQVRRWLNILAVATLGLFLLLFTMGAYMYVANSHRIDEIQEVSARTREVSVTNRKALLALCAVQDDLELRLRRGRTFLRTHPLGIPGVPVKTFRDSLDSQQNTLDTISPYLDACPEPLPDG